MKPNKSLCSATAASISGWRPGTVFARVVLDIKIERNHRGVPELVLAEAGQGG
jgi:hypothetical protein